MTEPAASAPAPAAPETLAPAEALAQAEAMRADWARHDGNPDARERYERLILRGYSDPDALTAPRAIPAGLSPAQLDERLLATREAMHAEENGSPKYRQLLGEYEQLLHARHEPPASDAKPADETPADHRSYAAELARDLAEPGVFQLDAKDVTQGLALIERVVGADQVQALGAVGVNALRLANLDIDAHGRPDPETVEAELDQEFTEADWDAADAAWTRLEQEWPEAAKDATERGTRYHPRFVRFMRDAGRELARRGGA
jgi:hypothetical protein